MILKIIGSIFIIGSASILGMYMGSLEAYRISDLQELKKALAILRAEIEFLLTPLPESLANVASKTKAPISRIFLKMSQNLSINRQESVGDLWERSILSHEKELFLTRGDLEQLISFGNTLGYLDLSMQLSSIYILTKYIDATVVELREIRDKNRKMYRSLGILGGLIVVIIFI